MVNIREEWAYIITCRGGFLISVQLILQHVVVIIVIDDEPIAVPWIVKPPFNRPYSLVKISTL